MSLLEGTRRGELEQGGRALWLLRAGAPEHRPLQGDLYVDTLVVGGGVVGLTTAVLLAERRRLVALVEATRVGTGVTGHSTAKATVQHGLALSRIARRHDVATAGAYLEAQLAGLAWIERALEHVDADAETQLSWVFAGDDAERRQLEEEHRLYRHFEQPVALRDRSSLPVPTTGALGVPDQLQLDPYRYQLGLARRLVDLGGRVFEHTRAVGVTGDRLLFVDTDGGRVLARGVVVATHAPIVRHRRLRTRMLARRGYVSVCEVAPGSAPEGMHVSAACPTRSVRSLRLAGARDAVVVAGEGHRTRDEPARDPYGRLERWAGETFAAERVVARWSTEDLVTTDRLPLVGRVGRRPLYIATGFGGWGLTNGTAAAHVIAAQILGDEVPGWSRALEPSRLGGRAARALLDDTLSTLRRRVARRLRA